ncbi:SDR family NAD(P)-dependent oxidoreductase [Sphingomonas koreensis]|uniref:SDR family NAD(P)-dependent oxidoreductase n=1 Tax=Sphingomonas koreensis TaxID=93064 RepID=A0A430G1Q2_9SPHN|nr:SDR family NAD(P)-dependent oxidoreductase [Sphingomonas koreensis]RSY82015.1 SDR family NAD(P)-dependent oxidoreductase [Sphingomonas koreensis]
MTSVSSGYLPLTGRSVLVTGARGDIGRATVHLLASRGARVIAVDRHDMLPPPGESHDGVAWIAGDVTDESSVRSFVAQALALAGTIDILVNNAGVTGPMLALPHLTLQDFTRVFAVNVQGVFLGMKHVIPHMRDTGSGCIVNMASTAGLAATPLASAYIASKHAVIGLTRAAAAECASGGIRVNCVAPGPIEGSMMNAMLDGLASVGDVVRTRIPAGRFGSPDEVARVIAFLASDDASHMHGAVIPVDGGRTAV